MEETAQSTEETLTPAQKKRRRYGLPELDKATLEALEAKHEDVLVLNGDEEMSPWILVLRRPTRAETLVYKSASRREEGNQAVIANEQIIRATAVWPETHHIDKMFSKWAMLADGIALNPTWRQFIGVATEAGLKG